MGDTLFGYTIGEDDGALVLTLRGALAEGAIRRLRERVEGGESFPVAALLSPLLPLGRLLSAPVQLRSEAVPASPWVSFDEEALNQQVDQTLASFAQQMQEFTAALAEFEARATGPTAPSDAPLEARSDAPAMAPPEAPPEARTDAPPEVGSAAAEPEGSEEPPEPHPAKPSRRQAGKGA